MTITKVCTKCRLDKPLECFNNASKGKYGKQALCRDCQIEHQRMYYEANKETINQRAVDRRKNCPKAKRRHEKAQKKWIENNPDRYKEIWRATNKRYREKVLRSVSEELKCMKCGCDKIEFLEINHKNGGGAKEVKHRNQDFYAKILSGERATDDLELLCKPCNNLHYLELKYGSQPFKIIWEGTHE